MNYLYRAYLFLTSPLYRLYEKKLDKQIRGGLIPKHIAIIMDGNRRFARQIGMSTKEGHTRGKDKLEEVMDWAMNLGIRYMTVYAFSTENFNRSEAEVKALMDLFEENFHRLAEEERVHKNKIRVRVLGQRDRLPDRVIKAIEHAEERTRKYNRYNYNLAIAYGGREEIINGIRNISSDVKDGKFDPDDIDEKLFHVA